MKTVHIWKGPTKLNLTDSSSDKVPQDPIKIGSIGETLFILDSNHTIWFGQICLDFSVEFRESYIKAVDFVCTRSILYFLSDHGKVYKIFPDNLEKTFEVILFEEAKSCAHGHTTNSKHIFVKSISAGNMGVLFLSDTGHLWVCGEHPQLDIHKDDEPTKVGFFEGRHITSTSSGKDFNVVITHKRESGMCSTTHDEVIKSDEGNVFSTACPQCVSDNINSPLSPQTYCDTCPLGLHVSNDSPSPSTPTSRNNTIASEDRNNDNDNTSSSTEEDSCSIVRDEKCSPENKEEEDSISVIVEKGDGMGLLHINTESARQFLTRQLSWVSSGGEELLAEVSVPTKIIKQNVSTVASFVYEGVKTVGDKVATLSRHMSGGSENNSDSFDDFVTDEFNLSHASNTSSIKCEWSCSGACSEVSDRGIAERLALILARGARLVKTELWTWGSVQHGQLGTGDMVKRHRPVLVNQLLHGGVDRVVCGDSHCLAVTLTGMCYVWGANECGQVSAERRGEDISSPVAWGHVLRVAAGARHSVLIASDHSLHWLGKFRNEEMDEFDLLDGEIPLHVLCCGEFTCIVAGTPDSDVASSTDLASEQCFLEEMLAVQSSVLKPLARRSNLDDMISTLSSRYTDLLQLTAVNVASMSQGMSSFKLLQDHIEEYLQIYEMYLTSVCNMIAMSGFNQLARVVDIPSKLVSIFSDRLPSRKTSPEAILTCAFTHPLNRVSVYKMMLSRGQSPVPAEATKWEEFCDRQDSLRKQADSTRLFWESCGRLVDSLRTPGRRLVRESRSHPLSVQNVSRFSSQWLILLSDTLVYVSGNSQVLYNLDTLWVDTIPDNETLQNVLLVTTPEETLTLVAPSPSDKTDWLRAFQNTIKTKLNKLQAPSARTASYTFTKHTTYKDATYTGRWVAGKMEGPGRLAWADGRMYTGQFHCNLPHGLGQLESPGLSIYEGQWKDGLQNGLGTTRYENGDFYKGYYKDGLACGHGVRKSGSFIQSNTATVYVGEWVNGLRQGYGVMDDIFTGEKYLGSWNNNLKNGTGLIVTLEGIYYEGVFVQDVLTGHGVMVFEDGTHYEGELRAAGLFGGKGTLTFSTGDRFEGTLHGSWNEGIKITGTLHKNMPNCTPQRLKSKPSSFGKLCVPPHQKWKAIFRQCWVALGAGPDAKTADTQRAWDSIAVALTSQPASLHRHHESLLTIPQFGRLSLDSQSYHSICTYLSQAFESNYHPLGIALRELTEAYNATYGGQVHLLLLTHAVEELHSIADRLYQLVCLLFPALPPPTREMQLPDNEKVVVSLAGTLHPILLPRFHSALFELYALHNKTQDNCYWKRLIKWNKQPNSTLMAFLGIDRKFWFGADENQQIGAEHHFSTAVETLQQLKTTFCPLEKLMVIQNTFEQMTKVVRSELGPDYLWTMDELFPVFVFVVVRSCISQLGSEIHFIEDFMEPRLANGEPGIMFTTLKAGYCLILQEKITIGS